ncbi:hypothetical protein RclHR1_06210007 [Rhizophagus clarus]|uniref:Uncharacterized protein n=1 Tax=Rhizophagus clarus TaxID=94130 RepID=A0A2Z6S958_9GLOM|nr:hypothetical protein RclHR1_06210007 [Rhizophagus clarus]
MINPQILANNYENVSIILNNITKKENNTPLIGYPVLIGSLAAKWHVPSFREPNDWDLVATPLQTILFINKIEESSATFNNIKLIHYPGGGLKLVGECIERSTDGKPINFDIELASDKVDLRNMKSNVNLNKDSNNDMLDDDEINKIEFEMFNDVQSKISSLMILELCRNVEDKTMFSLLSNFLCIVAPLKILEALKTSHIYWPVNFHRNIMDLHMLRILLNYNKALSTQPLCSPQRDEQIELMLKTRIKETEIIRGQPAAHINLNMSNKDFLDHDDNLFVQKRVPHDDLHELVKYGDHPIYKGLKDDQSKAWIKKSLFEELDYQTKLNCVKEETMVIALERYLIPMVSKNQENSYNLALARICTTLTKGWFRQFAIDNYPRLSNLDKDLLSIAHETIFESIRPYTEIISSLEDLQGLPQFYGSDASRTGIKITSPVNGDISITAIITTLCLVERECNPNADWTVSVVILPSKDLEILRNNNNNNENRDDNNKDDDNYDDENEDNEGFNIYFEEDERVRNGFRDPMNIHPYYYSHKKKFSDITSNHIFVLGIKADNGGGSWGVGNDVWGPICIEAKSADYVASILEIPDLTGDLLFKYVLDCLKPSLTRNGETPLKNWINKLKVQGEIPIEPKQHLWYHVWNYKLNEKSNQI